MLNLDSSHLDFEQTVAAVIEAVVRTQNGTVTALTDEPALQN